MTSIKYMKYKMTFDPARRVIRAQKPKFLGKQVATIQLDNIESISFGIGKMATFVLSIRTMHGDEFGVPLAGKLYENRAKKMAEVVAEAAGLVQVEKYGMVLYFERPRLAVGTIAHLP